MNADARVPIPGTHRIDWPGTSLAHELASDASILVTAWLRPRAGGELDVARATALAMTPPPRRTYDDRTELRTRTTADPADIETLRAYCAPFGIEIVETHWRSVVMRGSILQLIDAFGATAGIYETSDKRRFRLRTGALHAPQQVADILRGPFGIHQWPRSRALGAIHPHTVPLTGAEVTSRYTFPDADGSGQTIAVLQLRGEFRPADFRACMQAQGVNAALPIVKRVDNAELTHGIETSKDIESAIDTQIVAALAPGARIVVYAAPDSERGVLDAVRTALFDDEYAPSILSISFGFPEHVWTPIVLTILNELFTVAALIGVSVFCASGDHGAETGDDGKPHVLAPASSPFVQACGATQLDDALNEVAWDNSGGGYSEHFSAPPWQSAGPGRGVPDFAAQVRPGFTVFFDGTRFAMGGTSAVAPMWAALTARLNQRLGCAAGCFAPLLYATASRGALRDITGGSNGTYAAAAGWDPCTGLGVPIGDALESALR